MDNIARILIAEQELKIAEVKSILKQHGTNIDFDRVVLSAQGLWLKVKLPIWKKKAAILSKELKHPKYASLLEEELKCKAKAIVGADGGLWFVLWDKEHI